jgi:hypothetical protein
MSTTKKKTVAKRSNVRTYRTYSQYSGGYKSATQKATEFNITTWFIRFAATLFFVGAIYTLAKYFGF